MYCCCLQVSNAYVTMVTSRTYTLAAVWRMFALMVLSCARMGAPAQTPAARVWVVSLAAAAKSVKAMKKCVIAFSNFYPNYLRLPAYCKISNIWNATLCILLEPNLFSCVTFLRTLYSFILFRSLSSGWRQRKWRSDRLDVARLGIYGLSYLYEQPLWY